MKWYGIALAAGIFVQSFAAHAQNTTAPQVTVQQGLDQLKNHQAQQALAIFQQLLQSSPNDIAINLYAADAALQLYQGEPAVQYAEKARQLDPNNWCTPH
jgi:Tfp pilus assembly protein PilF